MTGAAREFVPFIRFLFVGGSFALLFAGTTAALIRFAGVPPLITSVLVYLICIPLALLAQKRFAFRAESTVRGALPIYAATQVVGLTLVSVVTSRFVQHVFWLDTLLYLVSAGLAAVVSFLILRFVIFRPA